MSRKSVLAGVKFTHDGAVAVVRDGVLDCVVEMEKTGNKARYSGIGNVGEILELMALGDAEPTDVDCWVVDGWFSQVVRHRKPYEDVDPAPDLTIRAAGGPVRLSVAAYRESPGMDPLEGISVDQALPQICAGYRSHHHTIGHLAGGFCTSPFAAEGRTTVVVVWDGGVSPRLYVVDPLRRRVHAEGSFLPLKGSSYAHIASRFPPFRSSDDAEARGSLGRRELSLPGKAMALAGFGQTNEELRDEIASAYRSMASTVAFDSFPQALAGAVEAASRRLEASAADAICTWQSFVAELLEGALAAALVRLELTDAPLVLVGGCALNINWNSRLRDGGRFGEVWVPPFPNDSGSALGAACAEMMRRQQRWSLDWDVYRGPHLRDEPLPAGWTAQPAGVAQVAELLHAGHPVVVLHGRAELGPRALGHRSILAPATDSGMRDLLNQIKQREPFRPVAPVCLEERAADVFEPGGPDPFMLFQHRVRPAWRRRIPAVVHADGTARLQTVTRAQEPVIHELLRQYEMLSGLPVLCNTSANLPGRGFFPSVADVLRWGRVRHVWCGNVLYSASSRPLSAEGLLASQGT